jgi:hypothetical protein
MNKSGCKACFGLELHRKLDFLLLPSYPDEKNPKTFEVQTVATQIRHVKYGY